MKRDALLEALQKTRELLARPENNFLWSSWKDADDALREIDALIDDVRKGAVLDKAHLGMLFAPTGPIQEVSLSSDWADTFLELANQIDDALR